MRVVQKQGRTLSVHSRAASSSLKDSLDGWLESVSPRSSSRVVRPRIAILTGDDFMRVSNATVREGGSHCIWPPEVLEKILTAEVISESAAEHYRVSDPNVTRVG